MIEIKFQNILNLLVIKNIETKTNNSTPFERNQFIGGNEKKSKTEKKRQKQNLLASW